MKTLLGLGLGMAALVVSSCAATLTNGGFEAGLDGWRPLWTREPDTGTLVLDHATVHAGGAAAQIQHRGERDWSFEPAARVPATPGEVFELEAWLKLESQGGSATLCVSTWDKQGQALDWSYGERSLHATTGWQQVRSRFVVPDEVVQIQPRLIGYGPATVWVDDFALQKAVGPVARRTPGLPAVLAISNATLTVALQTSNATLTVLDRRTGEQFVQRPLSREILLTDATVSRSGLKLALVNGASGMELTGRLELEPDVPEFTLDLAGTGEMFAPLRFPHPFAARAGEYLVVPLNEGISYPVDDPAIPPMRLIAYGGHGICMAFWGATDGARGHMAILETPDDAAIRIDRAGGRLVVAPEWDAQRGRWGYARRLRYVFFDRGGHVAMAKRYREHARKAGRFKTLAQKREENPNVDLLVGAVNVWCWDRDAVPLVKEMQAAGIDRILWSNRQSPENVRALNDLGVLTSRYDIYQDVMNPDNFRSLSGVHSDWTTDAWPDDIVLDADGNWLRGWAVKGRDGRWYPCGVICDRRAPDYARRRIPPELATTPYRCRFIDTTTAAPWHECYSTHHPMTRTESRVWKMELLRYVSADCRLVTGCETGHDASVPFLHYFEGMMSLGPYRVPDAGRDMARIWTNAPESVVRFQLGHAYRLPLWELVYHDCVVSQWYWGDYSNKLPMLWDQRDLFNVLYATPPMFMFTRDLWRENRDRFLRSYRNTCPYVRQVGYSEMTDHRFLTPDRDVQQTAFANGTTITVNFGRASHVLPDGAAIPALGFRVDKR